MTYTRQRFSLPALAVVCLAATAVGQAAVTVKPSLPDATAGQSYSARLEATGGSSYTWSLGGGQLPPGLTLRADGLMSGTPTAPGIYNPRVTARDSATGQTGSATLAIEVMNPNISRNVIWSDGFESGSLSGWGGGTGGGEFNSGSADSTPTRDHARTGSFGLQMRINTPPESGTRMFRWKEPQQNNKLYYSAWYYFPQRYSVSQYWNLVQWKSKTNNGKNDPFFIVNVGNRSDGSMYLYLYNWQKRQRFEQSVKGLPVNQWFKIEGYYECTSSGNGRVTVWQDGTKLFDLANVQTRYSNGDCQWSTNNYSNGLSPSPASIYIDDAKIATGGSPSSGGGGGGTTEPPPTPLVISTSDIPDGVSGQSYSSLLTATGGTKPYSWSVASGQLPPGITLDSQGNLSGTPTSAGVFGFTAQVRDSAAAPQTATFGYSVNIASPPPVTSSLWRGTVETGDLSEWGQGSGGGEFNSGSGDSWASTDHAHSGRYSVALRITTPPESGTRMFRWAEPRAKTDLYYSAWLYFPTRYSVTNYWNLVQWKSKTASRNDPLWIVNVGNRSDGTMYLYLYNWITRQKYTQNLTNVPVGRWFKVEGFYKCAATNTGRVTFWQDGQLLFDMPNVQTRYGDGDCQWSINNYSDGVSPSTSTIYMDDAEIKEKR